MAVNRSDAYETFAHDPLQLADWLGDCDVAHVAMDSAAVDRSRWGTFLRSSFGCRLRMRNTSNPRPAGRRTTEAASG